MKQIDTAIKNLIKNSKKEWGIYAENLNTHNKYQLNSNEKFETASVIKIFILLALFNKVSQGKLPLNSPVLFKKKIS